MSSRRPPYRDEQIAAALGALDVPEHDDDFFKRLDQRLARPATWRARAARRRRRRWLLSGVAVGGGILALVFLATRNSGVEQAEAAKIRGRVAATLASIRTIQGELTYRATTPGTRQMSETRWWFALDAEGNFRLRQLGGPSDLAFDAKTGVERSLNTSASLGSGRFYAERVGVAPGPPDAGPSTGILEPQLVGVVQALRQDHDPAIRDVIYQGRPAWRVLLNVRPNSIYPDVDRLRVTIDKQSALPVAIIASLHRHLRSDTAISHLRLNRPLPPSVFTIHAPQGVQVLKTREGFRYTSLAQAQARVDYRPLVPTQVPSGYRLNAVAVAKTAAATGAGGDNPRSHMVVSLSYRRGIEQFLVTTRLRGRPGVRWSDPISAGEGLVEPGRPVRFSAGALAGSRATLVVSPRTGPHIWALTPSLVVTVSGDLSPAELIQVAGSLAPRS